MTLNTWIQLYLKLHAPELFSFMNQYIPFLVQAIFRHHRVPHPPILPSSVLAPCMVLSQVAYPDACCAALEHSIRDRGPGWVYHGYKSRKAQATSWKVHGIHVKGIARRVVLLTQVELAEA